MTEFELFQAALDIEDLSARQQFLENSCGGDAALRRRVDALLASHEGGSEFLRTPVVEQLAESADSGDEPTILAGEGSTREHDDVAATVPLEKSAAAGRSPGDSDDEVSLGYLEPASRSDSLGRLGHYEVLEVVGRGAFGTVLRAFDEKLHRVVAIKVMAPELATTSPARKRFLREAQASAAIRHENVVSIHAVDDKPLPYLVMEYIPGRTLQQRLEEQGPLDISSVLRIGRQIAAGLAAAHAINLIHRDIKPGNILLETGVPERVKITDFGLARTADDASLTQSGTIAGTPMYMAPEQALGKKLDQRADLFSLGSVLYQMLSGRPPFRAANTVAVLKRVVEDSPRPIEEIIPEVPQWMRDIVGRLLEKDPDRRFQTAQEVADRLGQCETELLTYGVVSSTGDAADRSNAQTVHYSPAPLGGSNASQGGQAATAPRAKSRVPTGVIVLAAVLVGIFAFSQRFLRWFDNTIPALYDFQGSGETLTDVSGHGHQGVVHGATGVKPGEPVLPSGSSETFTDAPSQAIAPFTAYQARAHQAAWAKHLGVPVDYANSISMKFVLIPPGEFLMGSRREEIDEAIEVAGSDETWKEHIRSEGPQHRVVLTRPVYLGVHEVTQAQYRTIVGKHVPYFSAAGIGSLSVRGQETGDHPVEMVTWNEAAEFCERLSRIEGREYGLPSEAVWEFACRAGTSSKYWSGEGAESLSMTAWFKGNAGGRTHVVGELSANPFGLYDMHGNVWEWVQDRWDTTYYGELEKNSAIDPLGTPSQAASIHVLRGGDWNGDASSCRSSHRHADAATARFGSIGFRVMLAVDAVKTAIPQRAAAGSAPSPLTPANPSSASWSEDDVERIAGLLPTHQVDEVRAALMRLNPGFDGEIKPTIRSGVVTALRFPTHNVTDIRPLRALRGLESLNLENPFALQGKLSDLSPLRGLPLTSLYLTHNKVADLTPLEGMRLAELSLYVCTRVNDLTPLRKMPLKYLQIGRTGVKDLSPLRGMPLQTLNMWETSVKDLTPLQGMSITTLNIDRTRVTDLTPLTGMPLTVIHLNVARFPEGLEILRGIGSLKTIGTSVKPYPASEFWQRYDAGEFGVFPKAKEGT